MAFMQLFYKSIIKSCKEYPLSAFDNKLEVWFKSQDFAFRKLHDLAYHDYYYAEFADFVMNLPCNIYEEYSDEMTGILIFIDEFQLIKDLDDKTAGFL